MGCPVGRCSRGLRGDRAEKEVEDAAEDEVEREYAEQDRHIRAEGLELPVRVIDLPPGNPAIG